MVDIREDTIFLCGVDGKMFALTSGKYSFYYRCENYELSNRKMGENKPCMNRLSLKDQEILFKKLEEMQSSGTLVEGTSGRIINLAFEIKKIEEHYLEVYVINTYKIPLQAKL